MAPELRAARAKADKALGRDGTEWKIDRDSLGQWRLFLNARNRRTWRATSIYSTVPHLDLAAGNIYAQVLRVAA